MKNKLIDLLYEGEEKCEYADCGQCEYLWRESCGFQLTADHLIANGVTVQKWISVKDRLPDLELVEANANDHNWYACLVAWRFTKDKISVRKAWYDGECFDDGFNGDITDDVTHWMPLPQPPRGE